MKWLVNNPEWYAKDALPHRPVILNQFKNGYAVVIHVFDPLRKLVVCRLSIYYEKHRDLSKKWEPIVSYISSHLSLLVMGMRSLSPLSNVEMDVKVENVMRKRSLRGGLSKLNDSLDHLIDKWVTDLARDKQDEQCRQHTRSLQEAYAKGKLVVVLGAGASMDYGLPDWNKLLRKLLTETFRDYIPESEMREVLSDMFLACASGSPIVSARQIKSRLQEQKKETESFEEQIRSIIYSDPKNPETSIYQDLIRLLPEKQGQFSRGINSIISYNYDDLVEKCLGDDGYECSVFGEKKEIQPGKFYVYHVHGFVPQAIPEQDRMSNESHEPTLDEKLYHEQYSKPYQWNNVIQLNKFSEFVCLLIGCSFNDPNLRRLMDISWSHLKPGKPRHYLIKKRRIPADAPYSLRLALLKAGLLASKGHSPQDKAEILRVVQSTVAKVMQLVDATEQRDLIEFGVQPFWVDDYDKDIHNLLQDIGRH